MKILVLDNYDSFTYNLVHILIHLGFDNKIDVVRNDKIALEAIDGYDKILISPGPGIPDEAGVLMEMVRTYGASKSILGICLGHQGIAEVYGSSLHNLETVLHGVVSRINILDQQEVIFRDVPDKIQVCHYHSWVVDPVTVSDEMEVTATNDQGLIMGLSHRKHDVKGLQFHPESILTEYGAKMIENWVKS